MRQCYDVPRQKTVMNYEPTFLPLHKTIYSNAIEIKESGRQRKGEMVLSLPV